MQTSYNPASLLLVVIVQKDHGGGVGGAVSGWSGIAGSG